MLSNNLLWIGEQRTPIRKDRGSDLVMDSVINYYGSDKPRLAYKFGKLFLDNGAFTAKMKGRDLEIEKVVFVQETLRPDKAIPLDYPFNAGLSLAQMKKFWDKTADNIIYWQSSTNLAGKLVPTLHAWDKESLVENVGWLEKHADADYIALGSLVDPQFAAYGGFFGDRQPRKELIDMICSALSCIEKRSDFKVHLMGFGSSPLMLHLAYYLGVKSTDSSGHRRKAAYGNIILPGTGERYLGGGSASFGNIAIDMTDPRHSRDLGLLERCSCPVCMVNKYQLWDDWRARAIHNEYIIKREAEKASRFLALGIEAYEKYLDNVVFSHTSLRYLWEYTKLRRKYYRISEVLFEEKET